MTLNRSLWCPEVPTVYMSKPCLCWRRVRSEEHTGSWEGRFGSSSHPTARAEGQHSQELQSSYAVCYYL